MKTLASDMLSGAVAGVGATCISNPFDVVKSKLQLQGELNLSHNRPFNDSILSTFGKLIRSGGLTSIQQGLGASVCYNVTLNSIRFGAFFFLATSEKNREGQGKGTSNIYREFISGACAGSLGAAFASPFAIARVRLQSASRTAELATGHQHQAKGTWDALRQIALGNDLPPQDGVKLRPSWRTARVAVSNLFSGAWPQVLRVGSAT